MTPADLIAFTDEIAGMFNAAEIPHPVHLSDGCEDAMIAAFKDIGPNDWVLGSWRMHYQCLLKGVPRDELIEAIRTGRSMSLCFPEHRIIASAIVGGVLPIAIGIAMAIERAGGNERVHVFLGDMTADTGIFDECYRYSAGHKLPVRWIIEDNEISVCTPTKEVWGRAPLLMWPEVTTYSYKSKYPHAGAGQRVQF